MKTGIDLQDIWAWASPLTWLWALALLYLWRTGGVTGYRKVRGCRVWALGHAGPWWWRKIWTRFRLGGAAWGGTWVVVKDPQDPRIIQHEIAHVMLQHRRYGPFMIPLYLLISIICGYREHPFEMQARAAVKRRGD